MNELPEQMPSAVRPPEAALLRDGSRVERLMHATGRLLVLAATLPLLVYSDRGDANTPPAFDLPAVLEQQAEADPLPELPMVPVMTTEAASSTSAEPEPAPEPTPEPAVASTHTVAPSASPQPSPTTTASTPDKAADTTQTAPSKTAIPTTAQPTHNKHTDSEKAKPQANPNIQQGIPMCAPERLVVKNVIPTKLPDGSVLAAKKPLIDVTTSPYAGDFVGYAEDGTPLYSYDPPVAQVPGDERANYIHRPDQPKQGGGTVPGILGEPNTLPIISKDKKLAPQDDNVIFMSHSTNHEYDTSRWMAFQLLRYAEVGAIAQVQTTCGMFVYELQTPVREIKKLDMPGDKGTWEPIKNTIVIATCLPAISGGNSENDASDENGGGTRVAADEEKNVTSRWVLVAAKA